MSVQRVLLTTGGTGGHIFPALACAEELRRRNPSVAITFVGGAYGPEGDLAARAGLDFIALPVRGLFGRGFKAVGAGISILKGIATARSIIRTAQPDVVIGFGGYAAFAAVCAARLAGVPCAIHEQNAVPGMANKLLGKMVDRIFLSLPDAAAAFNARKTLLTGNPVRAAIVEAGMRAQSAPRAWGRNLLVMGGSLGAKAVNSHMLELLPALHKAGVNIVHQTGTADLERVRAGYTQEGFDPVRAQAFIDDVAAAYEWADLVLCRAGATTVGELCVAGKASILIPFPQATHNHQVQNARQLEKAGAAVLIEQANLPQANLAERIPALLADTERLLAMSEAARGLARPNAAATLADELEALVAKKRGDAARAQ